MSDMKISCPNCGQHIACGPEWAGRQIACPTCQKPMVIPGTPAAAAAAVPLPPAAAQPRLVTPASAHSAAPPPPTSPPPRTSSSASGTPAALPVNPRAYTPQPTATGFTGAGPKRTSGLAIASLVCSILSCVGGFIPGIICGHLARSRMRKDPSLGGAGLATAGLWVGYIFATLNLISLVLVLSGVVSLKDKGLAGVNSSQTPPARRDPGTGTRPAAPESAPARSRPARPSRSSGIPYREAKLPMPENPVSGKVGPMDFKYEHAILQGGWLTLRQGDDFMADAEVVITLFASNDSLEGRTIRVAPGARAGTIPHIRAKWKVDGTQKTEILMSDYTLTVSFEKIQEGKIRGSIDLELPGKGDTKIQGNFNATVK